MCFFFKVWHWATWILDDLPKTKILITVDSSRHAQPLLVGIQVVEECLHQTGAILREQRSQVTGGRWMEMVTGRPTKEQRDQMRLEGSEDSNPMANSNVCRLMAWRSDRVSRTMSHRDKPVTGAPVGALRGISTVFEIGSETGWCRNVYIETFRVYPSNEPTIS